MGGIPLGGGHGNFRPCPGIQAVVGIFRDGAAHHIHNGQCLRPSALALPHGGDGVRRLPRLGQHNQQGMAVNQRVGISQLTGKLRGHRDAAKPLDGVSSGAPGIVCRAAGGDDDFVDPCQVDIHIVQDDFSLFQPGGHGGFHRAGLLHDFFQHKVVIAALFRRLDVPGNAADFLADWLACAVIDLDALRLQLRKLPVLHVNRIPGMRHQGGDIGGEEVLPHPNPQNQRAGLPHHQHRPRCIGAEDSQGVRPMQPGGGFHHSPAEIPVVVHLHQMHHHLRIRLAFKMVAPVGQLPAKLHIVFNDAVVYHGEFAVAAGMGMGVGIRGRAMGRPAGVANAAEARHQRAVLRLFAQSGDTAGDFADGNAALLHNGDARRVIAPVFQLFQTVQQNRGGVLRAGVSNNSAHIKSPYAVKIHEPLHYSRYVPIPQLFLSK